MSFWKKLFGIKQPAPAATSQPTVRQAHPLGARANKKPERANNDIDGLGGSDGISSLLTISQQTGGHEPDR
jgi:hypothetical protein